MGYYFPQAVMTLRIRWEDFSNGEKILQDNYKLNVIAKDVRVQINDYTKADTFSATIDYKNFPFDPRCIRALGVTVHMENKEATFVSNPKSADFNRLNLITPKPENTIFVGFADEESVSFDDSSRTVSFEGRDYTSLLIDAKFPGKTLDLGRPLDQIIQELISGLATTQNLKIVNKTGEALPNIGSYAPDYSPLGRDRSSKKREKYWDVITDIVQRAGLIAYIELDSLVITNPRVLYGDSKHYQFIFGHNLTSLKFKRKLGRQKGININVRSANLERKEVIEVKIPEQSTLAWANSIGVAQSRQKIQKIDTNGDVKEEDAPFMTFNIPNISNIEQLTKIGEGIYEEIGRQQIEGGLETKEMCLLQDGVEFDITKIRNGTPVKIEISSDDLNKIQRIENEGARVRWLKARCYPDAIAKALAKTLGKFETRFYTRQVEFTINQDQGFRMALDFVNFIELGNKGIGKNG